MSTATGDDVRHADPFLAAMGRPTLREELGTEIYEQRVRDRAYTLWRTGYSDDANTNWFEAERQLQEEFNRF